MLGELDLATVILMQKCSYIVGMLSFIYLKLTNRGLHGPTALAAGFAAMAAGSTLAGYGEWGIMSPALWQFGSIVFGIVGYALIWLGLKIVSDGRAASRGTVSAVCLIALLAIVLAQQVADNNAYRAALFNGCAAVAYLAGAGGLFARWRKEPLLSRFALGAIAGISGLISLSVAKSVLLPQYAAIDLVNAFFLIIMLNFAIALFVMMLVAERSERKLLVLANTDPLTGVKNRRFFFQAMPAVPGRNDAAMLLDIDHFKSINDRFGHAVGDSVLQEVAKRIGGSIRGGDVLARYGGEEFIIFLPGAGVQKACMIGERIRDAIAITEVDCGGLRVGVTISIGVATSGDMRCDLQTLAKMADRALYRAKTDGRNCVREALAA
ncbi:MULTISPECIES: GGDEF domain-containing protein [Rhizobium/Agrobacterium group]|uniref:GGDEF domain-containing protein n=1 Tax=Rhizobium/Agrobacterium group TaxID=227290 RepID=UPI0003F1F1E3|nr:MULTISPECIES: GGDEF domain-containing protein [Rhizobium/Agrobacterium group]AHK02002.1 GGDEF domain protein [Agrobacterium tumefaciens LBA4213 (Ach5)]AKC07835.1 GGDEF family protein [Agrobacterium tumefaciens]AYM16675.1 GGDEF family protein [Agrobacterium tumefaciens]AYM67976.1 GGDEF family protein [Agrobacterium tumefaciens]NIB55563.1 GGDEF domain-containing protein [Agrobacterium tumefaciens]